MKGCGEGAGGALAVPPYTDSVLRRRILEPIVLVPPAAVLVLGLVVPVLGCGGDDDRPETEPPVSQTQPGSSPRQEEGSGSGGQSSDGSPAAGEQSNGDSASADTGGAGAPRSSAPRRKSLLRYLASKYGQSPWYPLLRKLEVNGGHVRIHLTFSPESDDEGPPVLACTAVLSYGRQVRDVTVYGSPTSQGRTAILRQC
jgi:hypothetical protein